MDYFAHPAISNSKLSWYKQSPAHFKYFQEHGQEDKPAYLIGGATHTVLLEPDTFKKNYYVLNENDRPEPEKDFRSSKNKQWKEEIMEAYSHKSIITVKEYDMIMLMMEQMQKNDQVKELLKDSTYEQEVFWTDPETGLACKKKVDISNTSFRADYKTTDNADPFKWQKKAWSFDYYRQAGFYDLDEPKEFWFIAQEKTAPYGISVHKCTPDMINYGKDESMKLLHQIKACIDADFWPSYEIKTPVDKKQDYFDFEIPGWVLQHQ